MASEITGFDGVTEVVGEKETSRPVHPDNLQAWQWLKKALSNLEQDRPKAARDYAVSALNQICETHSLAGGGWV